MRSVHDAFAYTRINHYRFAKLKVMNRRGFGSLLIILIVVVVLVAGGLWYYGSNNGGFFQNLSAFIAGNVLGSGNQYTVIVQKVGIGYVSSTVFTAPPGIFCGSQCSGMFPQSTTVDLYEHPASGIQFDKWTGCSSVSGTTCFVTKPYSTSTVFVTAYFEQANPRDVYPECPQGWEWPGIGLEPPRWHIVRVSMFRHVFDHNHRFFV